MVSVIVPVYNAVKFLNGAIGSILCQTYEDFELLLIDDGSTDGSAEFCDKYAEKDARIRVFHKENAGVSSARNMGLKKANGEWVLFVDSDDYIKHDMIEVLLKNSENTDRVICGFRRMLSDGRFKDYNVDEKVFYSTNTSAFRDSSDSFYLVALFPVWNGLYRKDSVEHFFNEEFLRDEDFLFNLEYMLEPKKLCIIPEVLYFYRMDTESSLTKTIWSDDPEHVECIHKYLKLLFRDSFSRQDYIVFRTIVARTYAWMEFIVRTDKIPFTAKKYIIGNAISKDYFTDSELPIELYDKKYQQLWNYAGKSELEEIFNLLA